MLEARIASDVDFSEDVIFKESPPTALEHGVTELSRITPCLKSQSGPVLRVGQQMCDGVHEQIEARIPNHLAICTRAHEFKPTVPVKTNHATAAGHRL